MNKYEAEIFARRWEGRGNEKQDTILFWQEFFEKVLEVPDYYDFADFEKPVTVSGAYNGPRLQNVVNPNQDQLQLDNTPPKRKATKKSIDVYIPSAKTIIEQKSIDKRLDMRYIQSDGELLSPF